MPTKVIEWKIPFILFKPSLKGLILNAFKLLFYKKDRKMYWQWVLLISYLGDDNDKIMSSCIFHRFIWKISSTVNEIHNLFPGNWTKYIKFTLAFYRLPSPFHHKQSAVGRGAFFVVWVMVSAFCRQAGDSAMASSCSCSFLKQTAVIWFWYRAL